MTIDSLSSHDTNENMIDIIETNKLESSRDNKLESSRDNKLESMTTHIHIYMYIQTHTNSHRESHILPLRVNELF